MVLNLNEKDRKSFEGLYRTLALNDTAVNLYSGYLNFTPRFITPELIADVADPKDRVAVEYACRALLAAALGTDPESGGLDKEFFRNYIVPSVVGLDVREYRNDPYYKNIRLPSVKDGDWELKYESYAPFELFVRDDPEFFSDHREIPRLGFFDTEFRFPAVLQGGREWMTVTPNEINTMKGAIKKAHGRVVTFGLGLGYFAYMASEKDEVREITVIEKDEKVIGLFKKHILPQFSHGEKIHIICADAFEYAKSELNGLGEAFVFADLWHDASDGLEMYAELRRLESLAPKVEFSYWIETSLLSHLRRLIAAELDSGEGRVLNSYGEITELLSDKFLREAVKDIKSK